MKKKRTIIIFIIIITYIQKKFSKNNILSHLKLFKRLFLIYPFFVKSSFNILDDSVNSIVQFLFTSNLTINLQSFIKKKKKYIYI